MQLKLKFERFFLVTKRANKIFDRYEMHEQKHSPGALSERYSFLFFLTV